MENGHIDYFFPLNLQRNFILRRCVALWVNGAFDDALLEKSNSFSNRASSRVAHGAPLRWCVMAHLHPPTLPHAHVPHVTLREYVVNKEM